MSADTDGPYRRTVREKLIEEAQVEMQRARSTVTRAEMAYDGRVPRQYRMELQRAVLDYYDALRPLREEGLIAEWWETVELSDSWTEQRIVRDVEVDGDVDSRRPARVLDWGQHAETVPVEGVDSLEGLRTAVEPYRETNRSMRGSREVTGQRKVVLEADALLDIASKLDDAANKLGFRPPMELVSATTNAV